MNDKAKVKPLTPAQRKWISRADVAGRIWYPFARGYGRSSWERCMRDLVQRGILVERYPGFDLAPRGIEYKRGADAAVRVWRKLKLPMGKWDERLLPLLSDEIGPNVPYPDAVMQGAKDRWADILAGRFMFYTDGTSYWSGL